MSFSVQDFLAAFTPEELAHLRALPEAEREAALEPLVRLYAKFGMSRESVFRQRMPPVLVTESPHVQPS